MIEPDRPPDDLEEILEIVMSHTAMSRSIDDDTLDLLGADVTNAFAQILSPAEYKKLEESIVQYFAQEVSKDGFFPWRDLRRRHGLHQIERITFVLGLTNDEGVGDLFNVTSDDIAKWRSGDISEISRLRLDEVYAIVRELQNIFRETRLWEIVREPLPALAGNSIVEAIKAHRESDVREALNRFATFIPWQG